MSTTSQKINSALISSILYRPFTVFNSIFISDIRIWPRNLLTIQDFQLTQEPSINTFCIQNNHSMHTICCHYIYNIYNMISRTLQTTYVCNKMWIFQKTESLRYRAITSYPPWIPSTPSVPFCLPHSLLFIFLRVILSG